MRWALLLLSLLAFAPGCRRGPASPVGPLDPTRPDQLPACPPGEPHLVVALDGIYSGTEQALLRFTRDLRPCRGAILSSTDFGEVASAGGLPDGTDLIGFSGSFRGGSVARFGPDGLLEQVADENYLPLHIAALTFSGQPAVAVLWGQRSSSDNGERIDVYTPSLSLLASWEVSFEVARIAPGPSGQPQRLAGMIGEGLQEYRADPGASTLAVTGELQITRPWGASVTRGLDVHGEHVRATGARGVMTWRRGMAPGFLGPVSCRWPALVDTVLPEENATYASGLVDLDPEATLVIVDGDLEGGSDESSHIYRLHPRGECELTTSFAEGYRAVAMAWSGR